MNPAEILRNQEVIYECALTFRRDANQLMTLLSAKFGIDLATLEGLTGEVYRHYNNKGILNSDWTYFFHGAECCFENSRTGQVVELIYTQRPEFGYLDGYFFFRYMQTTEAFKPLATKFTSHIEVWDVIELLADRGILTRVVSSPITRNILAYEIASFSKTPDEQY